MNYHPEHQLFPMVPFHALPQLHEAIKNQSAPACPSSWAAFCGIIPALLTQRHDALYVIEALVREAICKVKTQLNNQMILEDVAK